DEATIEILRLLGAVEPAQGTMHTQAQIRVLSIALPAMAFLQGLVLHTTTPSGDSATIAVLLKRWNQGDALEYRHAETWGLWIDGADQLSGFG
ncbi:hypothetical protein ABHI57_005615, partial [Pseudomonas aeruginosa]